MNRLRAARSLPVVSIVAPAGYGKTTLLTQWAARDGRPFVFVSLDAPETDAATLVARIAAAGGVPLGDEPPRGDTWVWGTAVPRLAGAVLASEPFALVLDDAHRLGADAGQAVTTLVRNVPYGSTIVLAGRDVPLPSLPRLRAGGQVLELGRDELAFTPREARTLLRRAGVTVSEHRLDGLLRTVESWPAGLNAAAISLRERDATYAIDLHEACLASLTPAQRDFLRRTSMLERLSAPLCDALLERHDSARQLASLRESPLLVPLGRDRAWFRQHRTFRELLRAELDAEYPGLAPVLERRAADWFEASSDLESALRHARAAGDAEHVAAILDTVALPMHDTGRDVALLAWIDCLAESPELAGHPRLIALAARLHAQRGNGPEARYWLAGVAQENGRARRRGRRAVDPRIGLVRAAMCADGAESMLVDVEAAVDDLAADDRWRPYGLLLQGIAHTLLGEPERGDAIFSRAAHAAERLGAAESRILALTQRSLLAGARGDRAGADALITSAAETMAGADLRMYPTCALTHALRARSQLLHGRAVDAASSLTLARNLSSGLTAALPWLAVQTRLELARGYVTMRDAAAARAILDEIDDLLAACADLGVLGSSRDRLAADVRVTPRSTAGRATGLTGAELKLLPMLATHLSFREIGLRFFLSRNTVKTQAISVYRKLGASNRSEAVERAHLLGLIDPEVDAASLILTG